MKNFFVKLSGLLLCLTTIFSCQELDHKEGTLCIRFLSTKSLEEIDTDDFLLTVEDSKSKVYYKGRYADSPEKMTVPSGNYTVSAVSTEFECAAFDEIQWGDSQVVSVKEGEIVNVLLNCTQLNSGVKLSISPSFKQAFPNAEIVLNGVGGQLIYGYDEERIAYFSSGKITAELVDNVLQKKQSLFTRQLAPQEILTIKLSSSLNAQTEGISIQVDTSIIHSVEELIIGDEKAKDKEEAFDVLAAKENIGSKEVWVYGYIVGCATSSTKYQFESPFEKNTNILIGLRTNSREKDYLLSVELKSGAIREILNVQDNSNLIGKKVFLKGDIVDSYFGLVGLKNIKEYNF